jgi:transposase
MFVREIAKPNGAIAIKIVESVRRGNKIVQKTVRSLGQHKDERELEIIRKAAQALIVELQNIREPVLDIFDPADFYSAKRRQKKVKASPEGQNVSVNYNRLREECRYNDGVYDVFGSLYEQLHFDDLITDTKQDAKWNETLEACVLARVAQPSSKKKTVSILKEQFNIKVDLDHVYRMMDHVSALEESIKSCVASQTLSLFKGKVDVLLFDVTTLYFESTDQDELRNFGFSKDCKFKQTQVVLALITTTDGTPMGYELFAGNTSEGKTLVHVIGQMKSRFDLSHVVLVADRAMFNKDNLEKMEELKVKYVVAAKLKSLNKKIKQEILDSSTFKINEVCGEIHWINEFATDENRRLIVSYSSKRAKKDKADRDRLIERLKKKEKNGKIKITDVVNNHGTRKYITCAKNEATINHDKIENDVQWDGLHGVITNETEEAAQAILTRYRDLWKIEEAFRFNKHDLKLRPIYHWKPERIRAHIAICYVAFALMSYARIRLKEHNVNISFETLREELIKAQSSLIRDTGNDALISIPSKTNQLQKDIYAAFGLNRRLTTTIISQGHPKM